MHRKAIELCGSCVVFLAVAGCETQTGKREEAPGKVAREEDEAVRAQREMAEEVRHEKERMQTKVGEAQEEVSEEYAEQKQKVGEEIAEVEEAPQPERAGSGKLPRFEAIKNETNIAFAQRADARMALLAAEIAVLAEQAKLAAADKRTEVDKEMTKARDAYTEAQKDLDEVRNRTGTFVDDGRLGVAMAINRAERKLQNVREDLKGTIY